MSSPIIRSLMDRAGAISQVGGLEQAMSFTHALGRLEPSDFHMVWNVWPLSTALIWMQLQNLDIKNTHTRQMVAQAEAAMARNMPGI